MIHLLRKHQQPVMIGITIVIIIAFGWFFTPGNRSHQGPDQGFRIYGKKYTREELERKGRRFSVAMYAGLNELILGLTMGNPSGEQAGSDFIFNGFVLDHEAKRLGITVNDSEVVGVIEKLPAFQTNGVYDPVKYSLFEENALKPRGFNAGQLEDLIRDQLRLEKLTALVGSTVAVTPGEFRAGYIQEHQKMHVSFISLDMAEFKAAVQPTDEEITKVFQEREKTFKSPEKRSVSYVKLDLNEAEKALKGKEMMEARQNLANRANDFGQDLLKENASFTDVAKKYGLEVKTTPEFTEAQPPADLAAVPQAASVAFKLTENERSSDALPVGNGYCILHLEKVTPSRQLSFEEARPLVIEQIKAERGNMNLLSKGNEVRAKIEADMKAGKSFADAAKAAGQKVETLPPFSLAEPLEKQANAREILTKAVELPDGELSDFFPVANGGLIVHLDKRDPIDEEQFKKDEQTQLSGMRKQKDLIAFVEWLQTRRKLANIQSAGPQQGVPE